MRAVVCDRCKKQIDQRDVWWELTASVDYSMSEEWRVDLCQDCEKAVRKEAGR